MEMSPALQSVLVVVLGLMILATIVGNILVCLSVILVRKLRHPSNYLLISLAVSDLCVGILVMPLALYYELKGTWNFGPRICDLWISFDVTCCTASILNLCMISVDRYLAITKPLTYGVKRRAKRLGMWIAAVWVSSCLISIPPLLIFGNDYGTEDDPRCAYSQSILYQLYATLGAFYIPLIVMITVYYKIYVAAKKVVEAEMRSQISFQCGASNRNLGHMQRVASGNRVECSTLVDSKSNPTEADLDVGRENESSELVMELIKERTSGQEKNGFRISSGGKTRAGNKSLIYPACAEKAKSLSGRSMLVSESNRVKTRSESKGAFGKISKTYGGKSSVWKERKASITLGVIMTAFIACWLPFFILALVRPIPIIGDIPHWLTSSALWLGFTNSMLNPIIYVKFHQDFRQAFRYLLCFQCGTMKARLREEAYYGANS